MNDLEAARLITRHLAEPLSADEARELEAHLEKSPQSLQFLEISKVVERAVFGSDGLEPNGDEQPGPGLSQLAKARIARNLEIELQRQSSSSSSTTGRLVAEDGHNYTSDLGSDKQIRSDQDVDGDSKN